MSLACWSVGVCVSGSCFTCADQSNCVTALTVCSWTLRTQVRASEWEHVFLLLPFSCRHSLFSSISASSLTVTLCLSCWCQSHLNWNLLDIREGVPSLLCMCVCLHRPRARQSHGGVLWPGSILRWSPRVRLSKLMKKVCHSPKSCFLSLITKLALQQNSSCL